MSLLYLQKELKHIKIIDIGRDSVYKLIRDIIDYI